jgi:EAL domain-containing protein (putative c-di-GMP-specific phosphodiesterase class I)
LIKRILVADDSQSIRDYLTRLLEEQTEAEVTCVPDGQAALDLIKTDYHPDLALLDLNMPKLDGAQLLRHLAELNFKTPIVIISGLSRQVIGAIEKLSTEYHLNVVGTIGKPIDLHSVESILDRIEDNAHNREQAAEIKTYEVLDALKKGSVEPWFQPQVELQRRKLVGFEVLCRIRHKRQGLLLPADFMHTLERSDLIRVVTIRLFEMALQDFLSLPDDLQHLTISFNLSAKLFDSDTFIDSLLRLINDSPVANERIIIEITETTVASTPLKELEGTARLAIAGCGLSIDDFGSGKATLERLHALPFSELKIDQQYLPKQQITEAQRALLESTISMARRLGMKVVVEGVESFQQWELVQHLGCELAQGYFIAAPMPFEQVPAWIDQWQSKT